MSAEVVSLGGNSDKRRRAEQDRQHPPNPLALGLLPGVAAELEPAPEHHDYHPDRRDDVEGDHDGQDRVDRVRVRTRGA